MAPEMLQIEKFTIYIFKQSNEFYKQFIWNTEFDMLNYSVSITRVVPKVMSNNFL